MKLYKFDPKVHQERLGRIRVERLEALEKERDELAGRLEETQKTKTLIVKRLQELSKVGFLDFEPCGEVGVSLLLASDLHRLEAIEDQSQAEKESL